MEEFDPWDDFPWPQYSDVKYPVNTNGGSNYTFFDVALGLVLVTETLFLGMFCLVVSWEQERTQLGPLEGVWYLYAQRDHKERNLSL